MSLCFSFTELPWATCSHDTRWWQPPSAPNAKRARVKAFVPSLFREWMAKEIQVQWGTGFSPGLTHLTSGQDEWRGLTRVFCGSFYETEHFGRKSSLSQLLRETVLCLASWVWSLCFVKYTQLRKGEKFLTSLSRDVSCFPSKHVFVKTLLEEWLPQLQSGMRLDNGFTSLDLKTRPQKRPEFFHIENK